MADREKLIELQQEAAKICGNKNCTVCRYRPKGFNCKYELTADHLIANGVTVANKLKATEPLTDRQQWIPVTERLPDNICPVLVALEGINAAFHGWYQDEKWWTVGAGSRPFTQKVTHWMPLPEPPKGE